MNDIKNLERSLYSGDMRSLAKTITWAEDQRNESRDKFIKFFKQLQYPDKKCLRIAITGTPGSGKSSFIESIGQIVTSENKKIAVLSIDPSSPITGGSILGDKVRMEKLSAHNLAFIRPSPTQGSLTGINDRTREAMNLCEAAGFDYIFVETVGVGQVEYKVSEMVDLFLLIISPLTGDSIQGIKRGILELADAILVSKYDGDSKRQAEKTSNEYAEASHLSNKSNQLIRPISNLNGDGIKEVWDWIKTRQKDNWNSILERRKLQRGSWILDLSREFVLREFHEYLVEKNITPNSEASDVYSAAEKISTPFFK